MGSRAKATESLNHIITNVLSNAHSPQKSLFVLLLSLLDFFASFVQIVELRTGVLHIGIYSSLSPDDIGDDVFDKYRFHCGFVA